MRATDATRILEYSVRQVLELMCFAEARPVSETFAYDSVIATSVHFHGSLSGRLWLETSSDGAKWLALSFLGLCERDVASISAAAEETVQELGSVICGRFLSLLDSSANLKIDRSMKDFPEVNAAGLPWQTFRADSGLLRVALQLDSTSGNTCR